MNVQPEATADTSRTSERLLVITAVEAERDAILRGAANADAARKLDVRAAGVGPAAAAACTARALATGTYRCVISAGIGGAFPTKAELGTVVIATEIVACDLGVETGDGFQSVQELGFGDDRVFVSSELSVRLAAALRKGGLAVTTGPIITVSTATGTATTAQTRAARVPGVVGEGMEGFGVATAAQAFGIPVVEIRGISNFVGPRDREAWRIPAALKALETTSPILQEVL